MLGQFNEKENDGELRVIFNSSRQFLLSELCTGPGVTHNVSWCRLVVLVNVASFCSTKCLMFIFERKTLKPGKLEKGKP